MTLIQESEDARSDRKFVKSQVEKRRRERMNRSLERLRTMLLQEPQQPGGLQRRVEKTEILEHTVLFLQNTTKGGSRGAGGGAGGQKHSFQDGFSTCLQSAAHFLGPEGKGLWLGAALDASFAARFDPAGAQMNPGAPTSSCRPHVKFILQMLRQKSDHRLHRRASGGVNSSPHPYRRFVQPEHPGASQQVQTQSQTRVERGASKQSPSENRPETQTLWRPWP